ncbi:dTMP kinase [Actinomadura chibensis]|uniref:Thymidylate kinase n=1 Tax=Actinomadura chibensis TaxID=392828 RepID=A0A5D0NXV3_9ACTN|nr:dTMP kinase [Actinomadura chibensis]TYB48841.1 dTMP kinase [Actinomadura chibensis]
MTRTGASRPHPAASPPPGVSPLSSIGPFRRLRSALALSGLGLWLAVPALTATAALLTRDDAAAVQVRAVGGVLVLLVLPAVLLAPVGGALAARVDRRLMLIVADVLRFVVVLTVPLVGTLPWTFAAAFLVACAGLLWTPAARASLPALVPDDELRPGAHRTANRVLVGPAPVAALLFAVLALIANGTLGRGSRADLALYVTAAVFLASAAAVALVREIPASEQVRVAAPVKAIFQGPGTAAARGVGVAVAAASLTAGAVVAVARVHTGELGGGDAGYGSVLAGLAIGLGFGLFLGPRVLVPFSRRRLLGLAVIAAALALVVIALVQNLVVAVFTTGFLGVFAGAAWATGTIALTDPDAPEDTRPAGYLRSVAVVTATVAFAAVSLVAGAVGSHRLDVGDSVYDFDGTGAAMLIAAVLALLAGLVGFRRLDDRRGIPLVPDLRAALRGEIYTPPEQAPAAERPARRERGVFIAFEGGEGAGKTTQARLAAIWLRDHGYDVVTTHEPGATKIGMRLRAMLLDRDTTGLSDRAESLLYAADRADHVANVIRPAIDRGAIVVSDRYVDSSLAYQGFGRQQRVEDIARVNAWATGGLVPDLTVLLEIPPQAGLGRLSAPADRIESESHDFHERVRAGFRALAEADPERYLILDASRPQNELSREIQYRIREILPDPVPAGAEDVTGSFPVITDY